MKIYTSEGQEVVLVTFHWSTKHGKCDECGLPAAFLSKDAYGPGKDMKLDAVCAANAATEGAIITRIDPEESQ